jgi:prepilin signal peptidase PulO-like enzyme (type II secretory pathway)
VRVAVTDEATYEPRPPIRELLTPRMAVVALVVGAALAAESFNKFGSTTYALIGAILGPVLALLSAIDLRHRLLPNIIVGPAAIAVAAVVAIGERHHLTAHLAAAALGGGVLFVLAIAKPAGMGMGDAKLTFLIGMALGFRTIAAMVFTSGFVILLALGLVIAHGPSGLKSTIPFGPLLALGALIAYFFTP